MEIIRHDDGSLTVPVIPARHSGDDEELDATATVEAEPAAPTTHTLHPGEGGYSEALAEWDAQQNPDHEVVSTASGREQAMAVVHAVAEDPAHVAEAVESLADAGASADALRHVLIGGTPSIQAFAGEVADAEGGDELPHHKATKIIGQVLAEIDTHPQ
jgi:hypothetical protein